MKTRVVSVFLALLVASSAFGQGTILFSTFVPGAANVDARISGPDGRGLGAYGASAQLFLVDGGTYTPLLPATTFRTGTSNPSEQFYVVPPSDAVVVPGIGAGEQATIVMRAWTGPSFNSALLRGETAPLTIILGGTPAGGNAPLPPAFLSNLQGFVIFPEPSVTALALVGAAALLLGKRKC